MLTVQFPPRVDRYLTMSEIVIAVQCEIRAEISAEARRNAWVIRRWMIEHVTGISGSVQGMGADKTRNQ